jgi:hypothetical protein
MIRELPEPIIVCIKSYLEIWERFGISRNFVSKIQDQLEWPRDINGYSNSSISYYSNPRLPKNNDLYPVIDLHLGHYKLVKYSYTFSFIFKEKSAIMSIHYKCSKIEPILDEIWSTKPFPKTINVFNKYIHLTYTMKNCVGYNNESDTIGEAQLLNHWLEIVKKITATK